MKQIRSFALLALPAALYAAGAHAQSSVTLYGIADAGIAYVHNAQNANGSNASSLVKFSSGDALSRRGYVLVKDSAPDVHMFKPVKHRDIGA